MGISRSVEFGRQRRNITTKVFRVLSVDSILVIFQFSIPLSHFSSFFTWKLEKEKNFLPSPPPLEIRHDLQSSTSVGLLTENFGTFFLFPSKLKKEELWTTISFHFFSEFCGSNGVQCSGSPWNQGALLLGLLQVQTPHQASRFSLFSSFVIFWFGCWPQKWRERIDGCFLLSLHFREHA